MEATAPTLASRGPTAGTPRNVQADPHRHIPRRQVLEIRNAYLFAEEARTPLNTFVSINFVGSRGWPAGARAPEQIGRIKERFRKAVEGWCRRQGIPLVNVYALENPAQGGRGPHIHILLHLPPGRWHELREALNGFLARTGGWREPACPEFKPFDIDEAERGSTDALRGLRYMVKGVAPQEVVTVGGERITLAQLSERTGTAAKPGVNLEPQGDTRVAKRAGSGRAVGKAARKAAGWTERDDLLWLSPGFEFRKLEAEVREMLAVAFATRRETVAVGA
jgi:hypothetical protein